MNRYRYTIIGSFAEGQKSVGGQSIKTRNFTDQLEKEVGNGSVNRIDTNGWRKSPLTLVKNIVMAIATSDEIVVLPAERGVTVIPRLVYYLRGFKKVKLKYVVVGGWLPKFLESRGKLANLLKKYDRIFVETYLMKSKLEETGFRNILVLPNFKQLHILKKGEMHFTNEEPFRICTFSRVLKEKGIEDAIFAVTYVNQNQKRSVYELDIYGRIEPSQEEWFEKLRKDLPPYVHYMGMADGSESTQILRKYFALIFPTYYAGEGYPGTMLDAFSAGIPVIASDWAYNSEILTEDLGIMFPTRDVEKLSEILESAMVNPSMLNSLKLSCLEYANKMRPESLIKVFLES